MTSEPTLEHLDTILECVHDHLSRSSLKTTRCLYTTSLVKDLAGRLGFEVNVWEGSARWHSRKYIQMVDEGYDFDSAQGLSPIAMEKRWVALRRKGVRVLSCDANEGSDADLGGHLCLTVRNHEQAYFVDPTSYQFVRDGEHPGARILAPNLMVCPIDWDQFESLPTFFFRRPQMVGFYTFTAVKKYRTLLAKSASEKVDTDLNPRRHPGLYDDIVAALADLGVHLEP
jgi:hypothetical protein